MIGFYMRATLLVNRIIAFIVKSEEKIRLLDTPEKGTTQIYKNRLILCICGTPHELECVNVILHYFQFDVPSISSDTCIARVLLS